MRRKKRKKNKVEKSKKKKMEAVEKVKRKTKQNKMETVQGSGKERQNGRKKDKIEERRNRQKKKKKGENKRETEDLGSKSHAVTYYATFQHSGNLRAEKKKKLIDVSVCPEVSGNAGLEGIVLGRG